jgi:nucleoid DNA-binding protein
MVNTFENGENIKVAGFGNFEIISKHGRVGRNPST